MNINRLNVLAILFGFVILGSAYANTLNIVINQTRTSMDTGQNSLITTNITGGTGNYVCSWNYYPLTNPSHVSYLSTNLCSIIFYGNSSDIASPEVINVAATDNAGDSGSSSTYLAVKPGLSSFTISASQNAIYPGNSINITNSTSGGLPPYSYSYVVPANVVESGNSFLFTESGNYVITETVVDSEQENLTASTNVIVLQTTQPIVVQVVPQHDTIDVGQSVQFSSNAIGGKGSYTYSWFVNGVLNVSSASNAFTFTPKTRGTYGVYVKVSDNYGDSSNSSTSTVTVNSQPTINLMPVTSNVIVGQSVAFTNATYNGTPPYSYSYTTQANAIESGNSFLFAKPGDYQITETVTDSVGKSASASSYVLVSAPKLNVSVYPTSANIDVGQSIKLNSSVSGGFGTYSYVWFVNNQQSGNSTSLVITPNVSGSDNVYLKVTDSAGDISYSQNSIITIYPELNISVAPSSASITPGQSIVLENTTTGGEAPYTYSYTVPANVAENGNTFTFASNGTYTITESVIDVNGEQASASSVITVQNIQKSLSVKISPGNYTIHKKQAVTLHAVLNTTVPNDTFLYQWYVELPCSGNFIVIPNATSKNYTFDTLPQQKKGTYYFIVGVNDITSSIYVNSTAASVTVITPASCSNPHYNNSNCDNDNQEDHCSKNGWQGSWSNGQFNNSKNCIKDTDNDSYPFNYTKPCDDNCYNYNYTKSFNYTKPCNNKTFSYNFTDNDNYKNYGNTLEQNHSSQNYGNQYKNMQYNTTKYNMPGYYNVSNNNNMNHTFDWGAVGGQTGVTYWIQQYVNNNHR
jgi:hypothetical protein